MASPLTRLKRTVSGREADLSFLIRPSTVPSVRMADDTTVGQGKRYAVRRDLRFGSMVSSERQKTAPRGQELPERVDSEAGESAEQRSPPIGIRPYRRGTSAAFSAHRSLLIERGVASGQGTASLPGAGARPHLTPLKVQDGSSQRKFPRGSQSARVGTVRAAPIALVGSPTR